MITIGHTYYQTPCKPLTKWLFYVLFWLIIPPMIVAMVAVELGAASVKRFGSHHQ